jgi:F420-non-reducing hydrogenase large subunit
MDNIAHDDTATKTAKRITIDPITRLEGHGRIEIFLNDDGYVDHAYFQVPELRGFEKFLQGRPAEDMPQLTSRICGVCPTAHHMAATKALDALYDVEPTPTARKLRELVYNAFVVEDHALHFYFLGGVDLIVGPDAPPEKRNILGVIEKVGIDAGRRVITVRRMLRDVITKVAGKVTHPVFGLPGGVAKRITTEDQQNIGDIACQALEFAKLTIGVFDDLVLRRPEYMELIRSSEFTQPTYYMSLVDADNRLSFCDGMIRVVDPYGREFCKFRPDQYLDFIAEHVEPWTYVKFCYLKSIGWKGFVSGADSGIYSVGPLARINVAEGFKTPLAQKEYEKFMSTLGGRPVHHTLANHWARLIELLYAAERLVELGDDPELAGNNIRTLPTTAPHEGVGAVEAPRGTLIHHYCTDARGLIESANLIVATQNNSARISLTIDAAAKALIRGPDVPRAALNMIEMGFRAYDPCNGCATHASGDAPFVIRFWNGRGRLVRTLGPTGRA